MNNLIQLFQLVDSSLPIGGFVYSMGMESAIKSKLLQTEDNLKRYLIAYANQIVSFEFPFLEAGCATTNEPKKWNELTSAYRGMLMNPILEKSALVLGKNWTRLLVSLYKTKQMSNLQKELKSEKIPLYYTIVFGIFMGRLSIDKKDARAMYLYAALRDQITVLTRLGIVGPMGAQGLLSYVLEKANKKNNDYKETSYHKATKSAYIMEIVQLNHDKIYSKLFQN